MVKILDRNPTGFMRFVFGEADAVQDGRLKVQITPKQVFTDKHGDFRVMPCVLEGSGWPRKTVKVIGSNYLQKTVPQVSPGKLLVLDPVENYCAWSIDACVISSARTGVLPAVIVRQIQPGAKTAWVSGAGRVGYYSAVYLGYLESVEKIYVSDARRERAIETIHDLRASKIPCEFLVGDNEEWPLVPCDVLVLATDSRAPVFYEDGQTRLVVSLGADAMGLREVDISAAGRKIIIDTPDAVHLGDLPAWQAESNGQVTIEATLWWAGRKEPDPQHTVVCSTGSAIMDNIAAGFVTNHAEVH